MMIKLNIYKASGTGILQEACKMNYKMHVIKGSCPLAPHINYIIL